MVKDIIDLECRNNDMMICATNAKLVLGDLFQDYNWVGERPTKEEADKLSIDAERIVTYIMIANDYVCQIKKGLQQTTIDIASLFDKAKKSESKEVIEKSLSQIENFKVPEEHNLTMAEVKEIINKNGNAKYESIHDAFKLGYMIAQQVYGEKVAL